MCSCTTIHIFVCIWRNKLKALLGQDDADWSSQNKSEFPGFAQKSEATVGHVPASTDVLHNHRPCLQGQPAFSLYLPWLIPSFQPAFITSTFNTGSVKRGNKESFRLAHLTISKGFYFHCAISAFFLLKVNFKAPKWKGKCFIDLRWSGGKGRDWLLLAWV